MIKPLGPESNYPKPQVIRSLARGGSQIECRIYEDHRDAVLRAWWESYENALLVNATETYNKEERSWLLTR